MSAGWESRVAIEHTDVVQTKETALEHVQPFRIFAIHPPREVDQQLVEDALEELTVANATATFLDLVDAPGGPRMHGRIGVAKRPLVCWQLPVRMHVPVSYTHLRAHETPEHLVC